MPENIMKIKKNKKKTNRQIHNDFVEINKKAHALGISYGQYVSLYMKEEK